MSLSKGQRQRSIYWRFFLWTLSIVAGIVAVTVAAIVADTIAAIVAVTVAAIVAYTIAAIVAAIPQAIDITQLNKNTTVFSDDEDLSKLCINFPLFYHTIRK